MGRDRIRGGLSSNRYSFAEGPVCQACAEFRFHEHLSSTYDGCVGPKFIGLDSVLTLLTHWIPQ